MPIYGERPPSREELKWIKARGVAKRIRDTRARAVSRKAEKRRQLVGLLLALAILGAMGAGAWWAYQAGWWSLALKPISL